MTTETFFTVARESFQAQKYDHATLRLLYKEYATTQLLLKEPGQISMFIDYAINGGIDANNPDKANNFYLWHYCNHILPINTFKDPITKGRTTYLHIKSNRHIALIKDDTGDVVGSIAFRPFQSMYPKQLVKCLAKATKANHIQVKQWKHDTAGNTRFVAHTQYPAGNIAKINYTVEYVPFF
ncbi:hypothetical protein SAMN05421788_110160 [Filimonas lacunae]|uniref:Uncharacterized protein n=1 Tax=Filimonas lacunae TaxID=477680 RepID=A0A173MA64_9BACT|nr:hypothetical protein [Filimonas lacunae]BAV04426.1 hypothetical protein FLA_0417 [Filimonas lacunae]SIT31408.1 hypothetical protein SAMN05421788_110160 [Filimonas lacunae]